MFRSRDELIRSLRAEGVSAAGARIVADAAKPGVRLVTARSAGADPLGATRIGGEPDLPAAMPWPSRAPYPDWEARAGQYRTMADRMRAAKSTGSEVSEAMAAGYHRQADLSVRPMPLSFVAQIDLAAVAAAGPVDADLPTEGRFLLFYDLEELPWGYRPADIEGARLLFDRTPVSDLSRRAAPPGPDAPRTIVPLACTLRPTLVPFDVGSDEACASMSDDDLDLMGEWSDSAEAVRGHRIGGHPHQIQGDMTHQCVMVSRGVDTGAAAPVTAGIDAEAERKDWVFLFQIDSDELNGMMWGDSGKLYLWIRRDNLRARRFEAARLILQCY